MWRIDYVGQVFVIKAGIIYQSHICMCIWLQIHAVAMLNKRRS